MGSSLGVHFANFYMGVVEEQIFSRIPRPHIYCRYIDDTFVSVDNEDGLRKLKKAFEEESLLKFTCERSENDKLPFLDVLVTHEGDTFGTTVYTKPTNLGLCLNGKSECPRRYLRSVVSTYVRRALSHCSSWTTTHTELDRISQILMNNGFSYNDVQQQIKTTLDDWYTTEQRPPQNNVEHIKLFYQAIMHTKYKEEEHAIKNIVQRHFTPTDPAKHLQLIIYYKNRKTSNLIMKNNPFPISDDLKKRMVVYYFKCPHEGGCPHTYVGMTTMRLSKRISCHGQEGAIFQHFTEKHIYVVPLTIF